MKPMEKIESVEQVCLLAKQRRALVYRGTKPKAAAFFQNWPGELLNREIKEGKFYLYEKKDPTTTAGQAPKEEAHSLPHEAR